MKEREQAVSDESSLLWSPVPTEAGQSMCPKELPAETNWKTGKEVGEENCAGVTIVLNFPP